MSKDFFDKITHINYVDFIEYSEKEGEYLLDIISEYSKKLKEKGVKERIDITDEHRNAYLLSRHIQFPDYKKENGLLHVDMRLPYYTLKDILKNFINITELDRIEEGKRDVVLRLLNEMNS